MKARFAETLKFLGTNYRRLIMDMEPVIYRDLGNGIDFEISGLNSSKRTYNVSVYIWKDAQRIIEIVNNIHSKEVLKETLDNLTRKYITAGR